MKTVTQDFISVIPSNDFGAIHIQKEVFTSIAYTACLDEKRAQLEALSKKPIHSVILDNELELSVEVKVHFGQNVNEVSESLQTKIAQTIEFMTGFRCKHINIKVIGFEFNAQ